MQIPLRVALLLRPSVSPGILLAVGFSTFALASTPFVIDLVIDEYGVSLTGASLVGVAQLGGFVISSWAAGRYLSPHRRVFVITLVLAVVANLLSATLPPYEVLIGLRFLSGVSLGMISWFAWVQVFGDDKGMGDIAVMGPLAGVAASPLIALFATGGSNSVFLLLGLVAIAPLVMNRGSGATHRVPAPEARSSPVPAAVIILVALAMFMIGGSAVFQYAVVIGTGDLGLSRGTIALIMSANAVVSIPAAKWPWNRGLPGPWMLTTAVCALLASTTSIPVVFALSLIFWGFGFWMGLPSAFKVLADRSINPSDRAGDAQAVMAAGRVVGPLIGGLALDRWGAVALGIVGPGLMAGAALVVFSLRVLVPARRQVEAQPG